MSFTETHLQSTLDIQQQPTTKTTIPTDITQQATTINTFSSSEKIKNPKRVQAGKLTAEKTRLAREQQKKELFELKQLQQKNDLTSPATAPPPATTPFQSNNQNSPHHLFFNQMIALGGLIVSAVGLYLRFEDVKSFFVGLNTSPPTEKKRKTEKIERENEHEQPTLRKRALRPMQ